MFLESLQILVTNLKDAKEKRQMISLGAEIAVYRQIWGGDERGGSNCRGTIPRWGTFYE